MRVKREIRGEQRKGKGERGGIANHPRENLKKAAIQGSKGKCKSENKIRKRKEVFDDDAVIPWCCFRERHCRDEANVCKAETRAGSCSSLEHTDAHMLPDRTAAVVGYYLTSLHLMLLDSHILPPKVALLDARLVRKKGVQWQQQTASQAAN